MRLRPGPLGGTAASATAALALLVLGCVFVAMAGPRASLHTRTRALQTTLADAPQPEMVVDAASDWDNFTSDLINENFTFDAPNEIRTVTAAQMTGVRQQLAHYLSTSGVPLGPAAAAWGSLFTSPTPAPGAAASAQSGAPPRMEIIYRDTLGLQSRLIAGRYPGRRRPARDTVNVAVTQPTASRFALRPGSRLKLPTSSNITLTLVVTGIVRPRDPHSTFWTADPVAAAPAFNQSTSPGAPSYWTGAVFIGAGGLRIVQTAFGALDLQLQWQLPLALGHLDADQAPAMEALLNRVSTQTPVLRGDLTPVAPTIVLATGADQVLSGFLSAQAAVQSVLSLLFVGLAVIGAVVLLLAARMVTARRMAEYALMRARGASLWQLTALTLRDTAIAVVPAALLGAGAAVALTPGRSPPLALWLAGATVLVALGGPPLAAAIQHRPVRHGGLAGTGHPAGTASGPVRRSARRWVGEIALTAAAAGGLIVLHAQGAPAAGGFNAYTSAAPVLVAIPAAICVLRLYPLALRSMLRLSARQPGVTGFLAVARAGRASAASALPLFALVLALTLAAFAGMVRDTVTRGEISASWRSAGADAVISASSISPAAVRALAAVPGVQHAVEASVMIWTMPDHRPVTAIALDPARYAALVASTPWPAFPAARLAGPASGPAPVLASPAVAATLGRRAARLQASPDYARASYARVRVAGVLSGTPALPAGGAFLVITSRAVPAAERSTPPSLMLITGPQLDEQRLAAVVRTLVPGAMTTLRSAELRKLSDSPLTHGTYLEFGAGIAAAAGLSAAILLLDLALGADEREMTLARLATMGLEPGQSRRLTMLETLPAVLVAAVAGACCAWALVPLTGPVLNLSVFTGSVSSVPVRPDFMALGLPVVGLVVLAAGTLLAQIRVGRRRGVTAALRIGGQ